jgi:hypothetical protein
VALERGAHPFFVAKTAAAGDVVDAVLGFFQQAPGGFQPEHFDCFGRSAAGLRLVASSEVSRTHAHVFGEQIDIQPFVAEIFRDPDMKVLESRRSQSLGLQELAELRLTAWPLHVDHQLPGDPVCTENLIRVDDMMESLKLAE